MTTEKIKVLHLLSSNSFSGAENVVCQIINLFQNDNFEMVYSSRDGQIRESLEKECITFYPLKNITVFEVSKLIKQFQPDIIHAHDARASVIANVFHRQVRVISHMHVNHESMGKMNLRTLSYLASVRSFEHIFWVSNSAFDKYIFKNKIQSKSSILYNVIDSEKTIQKSISEINENKYDVVYVGRLCYQKNPERLINVIIKAAREKKDLKVAIIGSGELSNEAREQVKKYNMEDVIHFLGFQKNPLKFVKDAKVMLMTSRFEGTPMCALEAMALGIPIVSTPVDGLVDVITDGVTGFLSEEDDVLAEKIIEIVSKDDLFQKLSVQSLESFKEINNLSDYHKRLYNVYVPK